MFAYSMVPVFAGSIRSLNTYHQTSNISCNLVGNKIVDHSYVAGTSPFGATQTTSPCSTWLEWIGLGQRQDETGNFYTLELFILEVWRSGPLFAPVRYVVIASSLRAIRSLNTYVLYWTHMEHVMFASSHSAIRSVNTIVPYCRTERHVASACVIHICKLNNWVPY